MAYRRHTRRALAKLPALAGLAMLAACTRVDVASGNGAIGQNDEGTSNGSESVESDSSVVFNYESGFAGAKDEIHTAWQATFSGNAINLTSSTNNHAGGEAWYLKKQDIRSFTTDFTFQIEPPGYGITFCIQNYTTPNFSGAFGTNAGADANMLGYGAYKFNGQTPVLNSVAIKFDASSANGLLKSKNPPSATGLYLNGGPAAAFLPQLDLSASRVNLHSGDVMEAHVVYDGHVLTMTLRDTVSNAQYRTSWAVDIPTIIGSVNAWIGFTGGTVPAAAQTIRSWTFRRGINPRLSLPKFSVEPGAYPSMQSVAIKASPGATIYYSTNGLQPTTSAIRYQSPISVTAATFIQAVAIQPGFTDSMVAAANYRIAPTGAPVIDFSNGFAQATGLIVLNGAAELNDAAIQMTDLTNLHEASAAWYASPVNVKSFTTQFTLQFIPPASGDAANGMAFVIQNPGKGASGEVKYISGGPNAIANQDTGLGYSGSTGTGGESIGLQNSLALKFDLQSDPGNTTGLFKNGVDLSGAGVPISNVILKSGDPINTTVSYDGKVLKLEMTDSKSHRKFSSSWTVDIPGTVGGDTAYVGFTAASGWKTAQQKVLSWRYANQ